VSLVDGNSICLWNTNMTNTTRIHGNEAGILARGGKGQNLSLFVHNYGFHDRRVSEWGKGGGGVAITLGAGVIYRMNGC
jgi:hypothetical protein